MINENNARGVLSSFEGKYAEGGKPQILVNGGSARTTDARELGKYMDKVFSDVKTSENELGR